MTVSSKIFVAISGGIDSAVAARLLQEEGFEVAGIFIRHSFQPTLDAAESANVAEKFRNQGGVLNVYSVSNDSTIAQEYSPKLFLLPVEAAQAVRVAERLGISLTIFDAEPRFQTVVRRFVETYLDGRTPNPCVLCNRILKFGELVPLARRLGGDFFATGHYVRLRSHSDWLKERSETENIPDWLLDQPSDQRFIERGNSAKDQSYVLYGIERDSLPRLRFPIGSFEKDQIRQKAIEIGLAFLATKKESQEICFVADREHIDFIRRFGDGRETKGFFVSSDGKFLGEHQGYERYTIGQRKGLGIGFGERIFVQKIDPARREVVLGPYEALARREIRASESRWHLNVPRNREIRCDVKIRYRNASSPATIFVGDDDSVVARLDEPRFGVAPGQSLVCYYGDRLLGGGIIQ